MGYSSRWKEILDEVADFEDRSQGGYIWFRGHSNEDYKLLSGLYRCTQLGDNLDNYFQYEKKLYKDFLDWGYLHHKEKGWNLLYLMQHHGVRTRLFDWSESFAVSLHFAFSMWNPEQSNACIWLLDPMKLNSFSIGRASLYSPPFEYTEFLQEPSYLGRTVALMPTKSTERMISQHGVFTVQGNTLLGLNEELQSTYSSANDCLKKMVLTEDLYKDAERYLKHSGVNPFSIFPDLDGLARYINNTAIRQFHRQDQPRQFV